MALKIAINGFGRIGRSVTRIASFRDEIEIVAINDLADIDTICYLLRNDSVHGVFGKSVEKLDEKSILIDGKKVAILSEKNPHEVHFEVYGTDVVLECSGLFLTTETVQHHIEKGIKRVILSAPTEDEVIPTFVMGVNEHKYAGEKIISNASCTTNCLAPIAKILDDMFGIEKGLMTTIHSYTNDQNLLDGTHRRDRRRMRAAAINMIPTTTGAAKAIDRVMPQLQGKLHGQSVRVPTPDVSIMDLNVVLAQETTEEELRRLFRQKAENEMNGILLVDREEGVSQDFVGCSYSSIVAEDLIQVIGGNLVKVMSWYDNEWGYSSRLLDMAIYISK